MSEAALLRAQVAAADKGLLELWRQAGLLTMPQVGRGGGGDVTAEGVTKC